MFLVLSCVFWNFQKLYVFMMSVVTLAGILIVKSSALGFCFYGGLGDKLSFLLVFLTLWLFTVLYFMSSKYEIAMKNVSLYSAMLTVLLLCLVASFLAKSLLVFYIFFEFSLIPLLGLIVGWGYQWERIQASFYLILYTVVGSLPLLFVIMTMMKSKTLEWFSGMLMSSFSGEGLNLLLLFIVMVSMMIKLPLFGVHLWLPKAHVEAPVSGSMVLAAVMLKFGVYGVYRFFFFFTSILIFQSSILVSFLVLGALLASVVASRQSDIKSLVAYSSISHMGILMSGVVFSGVSALKGSFIILLSHGFCSSALFFLVNFFFERSFSRQVVNLSGEMSMFYGVGFWWFLFLASNFSAPPFLSLMGELLVFFQGTMIDLSLMVIFMVISLMVAYFCIFIYSSVLHGKSFFHWSQVTPNDSLFLVLVFHIVPSVFLVLKPELI
uniref:NADH-ubiquinone oxidoreductase chain 4 n=1 Tax=Hypsibius dujardini TaxID=232323 RepID=E7BBB3_HYPDU|nr:NADH dehydrogenase subunit 4 [Hypsibius dujardini]CBY83894.1 NADH dehydogenase subunit 4 [Hypsibius dujardini]